MTPEEAEEALCAMLDTPSTTLLYEAFLGKMTEVQSFMVSWGKAGMDKDQILLTSSHFFMFLAVMGMKRAGATPSVILNHAREIAEGTVEVKL